MKTREMMKTGAIGIALLLSTGAAGLDEEFSPALTHSLLGSIENPAALVEEKKLTVGAQLAVESPDLRSLGQGSGGGALPADNYDYGNAGALRSTSFRAHVPVPYGIHLGVSGSLPGDFLRLHVPSGGERSYLRYTERNQKPEVSTGLGLALPLGSRWAWGFITRLRRKARCRLRPPVMAFMAAPWWMRHRCKFPTTVCVGRGGGAAIAWPWMAPTGGHRIRRPPLTLR